MQTSTNQVEQVNRTKRPIATPSPLIKMVNRIGGYVRNNQKLSRAEQVALEQLQKQINERMRLSQANQRSKDAKKVADKEQYKSIANTMRWGTIPESNDYTVSRGSSFVSDKEDAKTVANKERQKQARGNSQVEDDD